jgi:hypothetical protein
MSALNTFILDYAFSVNKLPEEIMKMPVNHFFAIFYRKQYNDLCQAFQNIKKYEQHYNKK